eukprot:GHVO01033173.1.p1 GENE.GHVO01033173.1~~GHVO01033173.1.p1  ORF type:complete len:349 (+),score=59.44 GHVO01033173.1:1215-2261(+)
MVTKNVILLWVTLWVCLGVWFIFYTSNWTPQKKVNVTEAKLDAIVKELQSMKNNIGVEQERFMHRFEDQSPKDLKDPQPVAVVATAPISLLIPCVDKHFSRINDFLESLKAQTVLPQETLIALSVPADRSAEFDVQRIMDLQIPNLKVFIRGGTNFAGSNRQFLSDRASAEILSFFDCDDVMHKQRIEILGKVFEKHPELDATLHGYKSFKLADWRENPSEFADRVYAESDINAWEVPWPFEVLRKQEPITKMYGNKTWNIKDSTSEPNQEKDIMKHWWFPRFFQLPKSNMPRTPPHNGWVTIRKRVADKIPYPDPPRGQDSLYNWRIMKLGYNFTQIYFVLGAYIHR